jgi:hypothetical protein
MGVETERRRESNTRADTLAKAGALKSSRGVRTILPVDMGDLYALMSNGRIVPRARWPPRDPTHLKPRQEVGEHHRSRKKEFPKESLTLMPLDLGMWHPRQTPCSKCEHQGVGQRYKCECQVPRWKWAMDKSIPNWRIHRHDRTDGVWRIQVSVRISNVKWILGDGGDYDWGASPTSIDSAQRDRQVFKGWAAIIVRFQAWSPR